MNDSKAIKASIGYTVGNYLLKGLSFLTIPIFARLLSTEDYGTVNTFGAYESIMFVIIGFAIHASYKNARYKYQMIAEGANPGQDYRTYVSNSFCLIWISGGVWFLLTLFFRNQVLQLIKLDYILVLLVIIYSTCNAIVVAFNSDVSINYEYKKYLTIAGINSIGNILISLALIYWVWPQKRYIGRIVGTIAPIAFIAVYLTANQIKRNKPVNFRIMIKWGLKYSFPIVPHGISQVILSSFDRIMITNMVSNVATGLYSFSYNIFVIIQVTASSLDTVWGPWFYEKRKNSEFQLIKRISSYYIFFLLAFASVIMLISPELILILGGEKYIDSVYCVVPIVCGGFFAMLYNIPASVEYYHEETKYIASATLSAALVNVAMNYFFIKKFGYIAASYTTFSTYLLYFIFHFVLSYKIERRCLFSKKAIICSVIGILLIAFVSLLTLYLVMIRLVIAIVLLIIGLYFEEKQFEMGRRIIKRIMRRS